MKATDEQLYKQIKKLMAQYNLNLRDTLYKIGSLHEYKFYKELIDKYETEHSK